MKRWAPVILAVLLGLLWFRAHDAQVRATALSEQRADSLTRVLAIFDSVQVVRDHERQAGEQEIVRLTAALTTSRTAFTRLRAESAAVSGTLLTHLDHDSTASDSLRALVNTTITVFSNQAAACQDALVSCDSIQAAQRAIILGLDSTVTERGDALEQLREMWQQAERRARPGIVKRLTMALPLMAASVVIWELAR